MEKEYPIGAYCKFFGAYAKVYTMSDDKGNVFYVGCTVKSVENRTAQHISEARTGAAYSNKKKNEIIKSLNFKIVVKIVDMLWVTGSKAQKTMSQTNELENMWIIKFHNLGYELCNRRRIKNAFPKIKPNPEFIGQTFITKANKKKEIEILESEVKEEEVK